MRPSRFRLLVEIIPVLLIACSLETPEQQSTPLAPSLAVNDGITPNGAFYPLAEGNEWHYRYRLEMQLIPDDGPAPPPEVLDDTVVRAQGQTSMPIGTEYRTEWDDYGDGRASVNLFRQDRRGLYMFDLLVTDSPSSDATPSSPRAAEPSPISRVAARLTTRAHLDPACVAEHVRKVSIAKAWAGSSPGDGLKPEEVLILAYPLHPGASWVVRTTPMVRSTVEGIDQIGGSPAYRVRLDNELLGPDDVVYYWYGHCGLSQYRLHVESLATDLDGAIIGRLVTEESWDLLSVDIDRGGCDVRADNGSAAGGGVNSYPIAVGNRWTYVIEYWDPLYDRETITIADNEQVASVDINGRRYIKEVTTAHAPEMWTTVDYVRQDRDGLYRLDPPTVASRTTGSRVAGLARAVASDAAAGEATQLAYPLKTGASWTMRNDPTLGLWTATVEGKERLELPAGDFDTFRIRITRSDETPGDELLVWYGKIGLARVLAHTQVEGRFLVEAWTLNKLHLVR